MTTITDTTLTANTDPTLTDATSSSSTTTLTASTAPVLTLDQADADYSPGETAVITASDVEVGGAVTFDVEHVLTDGTVASDLTGTGTAWTVTDGGDGDLDGVANGVIQTSWYVNDDAANQAFTLSATDAATGGTATVAFTDQPQDAAGVLQAPTGTQEHTGDDYNPNHWGVVEGDTITDTITGATDAYVVNGTVQVEIKSSGFGNTFVTGTYNNGTITFTWIVQGPDGGDICDTTVVAYQTGVGPGGQPIFTNVGSGTDKFGLAILNEDGSPDVDANHNGICDDEEGQAALTLSKDTVCPEDESHSVNGGTLLVGNKVEWVYTLKGVEGSVADVTLTDNQNGTDFVIYDAAGLHGGATLEYTSGDTDNLLEAGEVWTFKLTGDVTAGNYTNTATASGTNAATGEAGVTVHSGENSYTGVTAGVTIDKQISVDGIHWFDVGPGTLEALNLLTGSTVYYQAIVTNTGGLSETVSVTDVPAATVTFGGNATVTLAAGGFATSDTWTETVVAGTQKDTATANAITAKDDCGETATAKASDIAQYFGARPHIEITKDVVCVDDGNVVVLSDGAKLLSGDVHYQIQVTNDGNVALAAPDVTDDPAFLTLSAPTGDNGNGMLDVGETWTYLATGAWAAGSHSDTATATDSFTDSAGNTWNAGVEGHGVSDSASYLGLNPEIELTKLTNGSDGQDLLQGQAITWTYDVTNNGNVDLTGVSVSDSPSQTITAINGTGVYSAYNSGDTNHDGVLSQGETWHFMATGTAGTGPYTNTATATTAAVTDDCGDSVTPTATDGSSYTGHARAAEGLTKGYWATHLTLWDVYNGDEKGAGSEINVAGQYDWNKSGGSPTNVVQTDLTSNGPSSSLGLVKTTSKDSGLLMGDLNHDGLANDGHADLFFDLTSAQLLANNSVSGDARIILASQAVAAQLNEYQGYAAYGHDTSPNGLLSEAVQWLEGLGPLSSNGHSNVDTNTANDTGLPAETVINDAAGNDYTVTSGVITLGGTALSSSDASWQTKAQVFSEATANLDINGDGQKNDTVWANGEGLKNALAAYNHGLNGTAGFVVSTDGTTIGWENSSGGTPTDVHANAPDVFWGILANQGVTGVEWHLA